MSDYSDLSGGINVVTMLPTIAKAYFLNEASMINLGVDNNLAYKYEEGLLVYCAQEESSFRWREVLNGEVGRMSSNFTYPPNLYCGGINYSDRVFNFFPALFIPAATPYLQLRIKDKGIGNTNPYKLQVNDIVQGRKTQFTYWDSAVYIGDDPADRDNCYTPLVQTIIDFDNPDYPGPDDNQGPPGKSAYEIAVENGFVGTEEEWLESLQGADGTNGTNGISAYQVAVNNGFGGTEEQWLESLEGADGTNGTNGLSAYQVALNNGFVGTEAQWLLSLKGANGTSASNNFQDEITAGRTLTDADNNFVFDTNNGATPITIIVPATGLRAKFNCGFYLDGTADVTFAGAVGVTVENPIGLKGYGKGYSCYLERKGNTQTYWLQGDTKP